VSTNKRPSLAGWPNRHPGPNRLDFWTNLGNAPHMGIPKEPVTFVPAQVEELNTKLSDMRHNVNNYLSLIIAAVELVKHKPDSSPRMIEAIAQQPAKVIEELRKFSADFEKSMGITRD